MHRWTEHEDDDELDSRSMDEEKREVSHHRSERDTNDFECYFCDETFRTKWSVMEHKKLNIKRIWPTVGSLERVSANIVIQLVGLITK